MTCGLAIAIFILQKDSGPTTFNLPWEALPPPHPPPGRNHLLCALILPETFFSTGLGATCHQYPSTPLACELLQGRDGSCFGSPL